MLISFLVSGCAQKEEVYNKPDTYWFKEILSSLKRGNLKDADDYYTSLASEHRSSPLTEVSTIIMAQAHTENYEYILADFYVDEYISKYSNNTNVDYMRYLKIKIKYDSFRYPNRNQELLLSSIKDIEDFIKSNPNSHYLPLVNTILVRLEASNYVITENIIDLYSRQRKQSAKEYYEKKLGNSWLKSIDIEKPKIPWYRKPFE